ncbi:MAG: hypothetical protein F6K62_17375, partial [Sphaerospermopsis sp. SIO1G2]|nr:hypothetical protein [Sphaerospermopsis sp. SIO1G2]
MKLIESFGTENINGQTHDDLQDVMQTVINTAKLQLQEFAQTAEFNDRMIQVFGTSPAGLQSAWTNGLVILPEIEIVSSQEIDSANGAFAGVTNKIYLAQEFINANINNLDAVVKVVVEEYAHFIDNSINITDSKGDEGAKFAAFVFGDNLTPLQLQELDIEDDIATVVLGGEVVEIEKDDSSFDIVFDYRFAPEGAFDDLAKQRLEEAGRIWSDFIADEFPNIPIGTEISIRNPRTNQIETITLDQEIDDILIFVDAQPLDGAAGRTYSQPETPFPERYNGSDFTPWISFIDFDNSSDVFANIELVLHELGHALGIGIAPIFFEIADGNLFGGENSIAVNSEPIPIKEDEGHISGEFVLDNGLRPLVNELGIGSGLPTLADLAILADIGYEIPVLQSSPLPSTLNYTLNGTDSDDNLYGFDGDDTINGGNGNDTLFGFSNFRDPDGQFPVNDGNDILNGEAGDDYIQGNNGNDTLNGGTGNDNLEGNGGNDTFIFELNHGEDVISDFVGADDVISVAAEFGFSSGAEVLNAITNTFSGTVTINNETRESLISEIVLSTGNQITVYHDVELTADNFVIANSTNLPTISVNDISINEGNSGITEATLTISLSAASSDTITVDYSTADQTAIASQDYTTNSGTLTFNPGETSQTITIEILGDTTEETNETFLVNLSNAVNSSIADNQGIITIQNDDTTQVNNNPVATDDTETTPEGNPITINVLNNDTDTENNIDITTVAISTSPTNGTVAVDSVTGEITYTPTGDFSGEDSFTYTVQDGDGGTSNSATVNVTVTPVNDNPVATD